MYKIEVKWEGPFTIEEIKEKRNYGRDHGLYQIYGTHPIFGPKSLVYIGKTDEGTFGTRIPQHDDYVDWEYPEYEFYIGRLGSTGNVNYDEWSSQIDFAERILINYCSPPYNSKNIQHHGIIEDTQILVVNFGKRYRLPPIISTIGQESTINWREFTNE